MKSKEEKLRQQQLKKEFEKKEKDQFLDSLPIAINYFVELFNFLDEKLKNDCCDHTLRFSVGYLSENQLPVQSAIKWLNENGGYCDCEVLYNIEERFEVL